MTVHAKKYSGYLVLVHDVIGGKWKLQILSHIIEGHNRFSELKRCLPKITEKVLYSNLKSLELNNFIIRTEELIDNNRVVTYAINPINGDIEDVISALQVFAKRYAKDEKIKIM